METKPKRENADWNPFTQAKFIYEINRQTGNPVSWAEAYRTAELAVSGVQPAPAAEPAKPAEGSP